MPNQYSPTKTKEYVRPMPGDWWLKRPTYLLFMIRELTCVFVGGYALFLLCLVKAAGNPDPAVFAAILNSPLSITLQIIALPMVLYHAITWFNLVPKVLIVWRGEEKVDGRLIAGAHYVAWLVASVIIYVIVWRYG